MNTHLVVNWECVNKIKYNQIKPFGKVNYLIKLKVMVILNCYINLVELIKLTN